MKAEVFERHPEIGGLLTFGIPPFKLDKQLMAQRRQIFTDMGITFHLNCEVGKDIPFSRLMSEYDAVLLGVGTYGMMKAGWNMKIPGRGAGTAVPDRQYPRSDGPAGGG